MYDSIFRRECAYAGIDIPAYDSGQVVETRARTTVESDGSYVTKNSQTLVLVERI